MKPEPYEYPEWQPEMEEPLEVDELEMPESWVDIEAFDSSDMSLLAERLEKDDSFADELMEDFSLSWQARDAEEIAKVSNPILRQELMQENQRIAEKEEENDRRYADGEITKLQAELEAVHGILPEKTRHATKTAMAEVGLDHAQLGEVSDMANDLQRGNLANVEAKEELSEIVSEAGPERAEDVAWEKYKQGELDEEGRDLIRRKARLQRLKDAEEQAS